MLLLTNSSSKQVLSGRKRIPSRMIRFAFVRRVCFTSVMLFLLATVNPTFAEKTMVPTAAAIMLEAHNARAVWENFPGFSADVAATTDGVSTKGTIRVAKDFTWELDLDAKPHASWLDGKLRSVILHRKPSKMPDAGFSFVPGNGPGKLVANNDGSGVFRIKDGVIREVHRKSEKSWFEITNLELRETADGRNLPEMTAVVYRDPQTGNIQRHVSNIFKWKKSGAFELPKRAFTVEVGAEGQRMVRELVFTNHRLN